MVRKRIAIIPARGGSKRIPKKNIVDFNGRPMLDWTVEAALSSDLFERVLVSTDSEEIAEVALAAGAAVPFLREVHSDDDVPVSPATIAALIQAERYWDTRFDQVVQLMPNCPLRKSQHIRFAVAHADDHDIDFQISCFKYGWMNPWWAVELDSSFVPSRLFPSTAVMRSQDLAPLYCPTGAIWIAERDGLLKSGTFYGEGHRFFPMQWWTAVDIDDMDDLKMAKALSILEHDDVS